MLVKRVVLSLAYRGFFNWLSDRMFLRLVYFLHFNKKLDLKNPKTFNEKLQYLKLYDRNPEYTVMVDKYAVKKYVSDIIGKEYIIPTIGVWNSIDEIEFEQMPNQFVLKCTHDSGGIVVVRDKKKLDINKTQERFNRLLKRNYYYSSREWPYRNIKPQIMAEKYMEDSRSSDKKMTDYKFYCFNGEPKYLYVSVGMEDHKTAQISFLNMDWTFAEFGRSDYKPLDILPPKPQSFDEMIEIAKKLSKGIKFVRVDLYEVNGHVYFGELTFTPCGGFMPFYPKYADRKLGEWINIDEK